MENVCIVVPVFEDWKSLRVLLADLNTAARSLSQRLLVIVVDDGSIQPAEEMNDVWPTLDALAGVEVVTLAVNMGHQRAIAIGLCVAAGENDPDAVLVMDGDGEDPPQQVHRLLEAARGRQDYCIVAQRRKRTEKLPFRAAYVLYKSIFALLTGKRISFGNFSLLSRGYVQRLVMVADLWNNMAAAVLRSRLPIEYVPIDRGRRYAGESKMNYTSLIVHGLSGISVYADAIFVRLLLFTIFMFGVTVFTIAALLVLRIYFPAHATPGWATTLSMGMLILLLQALFTTLTAILMLLNNRVQRLIVPRTEYHAYIRERSLKSGSFAAIERSLQTPQSGAEAML